MTETPTAEQAVTSTQGRLIPNAIYARFGAIMIACDDNNLVHIAQSGDTKYVASGNEELLARPGSDDWIDRMCRVRVSLVRDLCNERTELRDTRTWIENLGNAILEKAIEKDWCEEYDEFAEEWDLPPRVSEWEVTMTVVVRARDEEAASELVSGALSIGPYDDNVVSGPDYSVEAH